MTVAFYHVWERASKGINHFALNYRRQLRWYSNCNEHRSHRSLIAGFYGVLLIYSSSLA